MPHALPQSRLSSAYRIPAIIMLISYDMPQKYCAPDIAMPASATRYLLFLHSPLFLHFTRLPERFDWPVIIICLGKRRNYRQRTAITTIWLLHAIYDICRAFYSTASRMPRLIGRFLATRSMHFAAEDARHYSRMLLWGGKIVAGHD